MIERDSVLIAKYMTRVNRMNNLVRSFMACGAKMQDHVMALAPYLSPEYKASFVSVYEDYRDNLEDLGEVLTLMGQDITDIGEEFAGFISEIKDEIKKQGG